MKKHLLNGAIIFITLCLVSYLGQDLFQGQFGHVSFWQRHGILFLVFITIFPRLTLIFSSVATGGIAWWLGFIFCPRILVALLATVNYFNTNPILVVMSWLVAISGETAEKVGISRQSYQVRNLNFGRKTQKKRYEDAVEVEYRNIN